jgi:hypothetical protein
MGEMHRSMVLMVTIDQCPEWVGSGPTHRNMAHDRFQAGRRIDTILLQ